MIFQAESVQRQMAPIPQNRERLSEIVDRRQTAIVSGATGAAVEPDWNGLLKQMDGVTETVRDRILASIAEELAKERGEFIRRLQAVNVHARGLALWSLRKTGLPVLKSDPNRPERVEFAEPLYTPEQAAAFWQKELGLADDVAATFLQTLQTAALDEIGLAYAKKILDSVSKLFETALSEGWSLSQFRKAFGDKIPGVSQNEIETLFRTGMSREYGRKQRELYKASNAFVPFLQWITVGDDRVRDNHAAMHGYVAANGDPIWDLWRVPAGWQCRCVLSPVPYTEAIRRGWAKRQGKTLILTKGPRPIGPPPNVKPDPGFGG